MNRGKKSHKKAPLFGNRCGFATGLCNRNAREESCFRNAYLRGFRSPPETEFQLGERDSAVRMPKAAFCEELAKAGKAIVRWYEAIREIDVRTMEILITLFGRPK